MTVAKTFRFFSCAALTFAVGVVSASFASANTIIDLVTPGVSSSQTATIGGTFIVTNSDNQSSGTGVIDPFLRIQQTGQERGYNSSLPSQYDAKDDPHTHALLLSQIPLIDIGGVFYREFLLDVNQASNGPISLNQIQIFQRNGDINTSTLSEATAAPNHFAVISGLGTEVFRMSVEATVTPGRDYEIQIDSDSGSGSGDMLLYVRNSLFNTSLSNVILFSQFGAPNGAYSSNAGFEEWAVDKEGIFTCPAGDPRCDVPIVPEPASLLLLATGLGVAARRLRKREIA